MCNSIVLKSSYHCWRCGQCAGNLDHHCKFLNCCIAQSNYLPFLRLVTIFIFYSDNLIALAIYECNFSTLAWAMLAGTAIETFFAVSLLVFHVFLNRCYNGSTRNFCLLKSNNKSKQI